MHPVFSGAVCGAAFFLGGGMALPIWESPYNFVCAARVPVTLWRALDAARGQPAWMLQRCTRPAVEANLRTAGVLVALGAGLGTLGTALRRIAP